MTTTTTTEIDWEAADQVASQLGLNTRRLVASGDADRALEWALQMSGQYTGIAALSYYELAVILGHRDPKATAGATLDWDELLLAVEALQAAVRVKAAEEKAAERAAEEKAAAEKAAAAQAAAEAEAAELEDDEDEEGEDDGV